MIQEKLRAELANLSFQCKEPTMDELHALPYLDAVVRETLRLYPVIPGGPREAAKDDVIPLSTPIIDRNGNRVDTIK